MPPIIVDVMQSFRASILRREQMQMELLAARWRDVEQALLGEMELLASDVRERQAAGLPVTRSAILRMERFQALLRDVQVQLLQFGGEAERQIINGQRELAALGIDHSQAMIGLAAGGRDIAFDRLVPAAVENMVGLAGDGSPLNTLLREGFGDGLERMTQELIRSTALGRNPRETARRMAMANREGLNRALTIARTEQLRVYREASRAQYEESGVVESFRRLATRSPTTCAACIMADGELYEVNQTLREHPNGRCAIVPVVIGMPAIRWQEGPDWFRQQPADVQRSILGPGKYDAWRAGRFDLDELVSVRRDAVWGDSVQPTPLRDLVGV